MNRVATRLAMVLMVGGPALLLAACEDRTAEKPETSTQSGIDRSVADVRAAEAAISAPVARSKSVAELTGKQPAGEDGSQKSAAPAEQAVETTAEAISEG
ncbi:MAG: hypothetical protein ACRC1J_00990 [Sandaracinobacteroides sp.]